MVYAVADSFDTLRQSVPCPVVDLLVNSYISESYYCNPRVMSTGESISQAFRSAVSEGMSFKDLMFF